MNKYWKTGSVDVVGVCKVMIFHANADSEAYKKYLGNHRCQLETLSQFMM